MYVHGAFPVDAHPDPAYIYNCWVDKKWKEKKKEEISYVHERGKNLVEKNAPSNALIHSFFRRHHHQTG